MALLVDCVPVAVAEASNQHFLGSYWLTCSQALAMFGSFLRRKRTHLLSKEVPGLLALVLGA